MDSKAKQIKPKSGILPKAAENSSLPKTKFQTFPSLRKHLETFLPQDQVIHKSFLQEESKGRSKELRKKQEEENRANFLFCKK